MKRTRSQKFLAFVMSVLLAFTTFAGDFNTLTATAAGNGATLSGTPSVETTTDGVKITKSATVEGDVATITFTVVGKNETTIVPTTSEAAVVFVMDLSNSMLYGDNDSTASNYSNTRLKKAKDAAKAFADGTNGIMKDSHVSVGVVTYGTNAYVDSELSKSSSAIATAIENIGKIKRENNESSVGNGNNKYYGAGGTNVQAGIKKAEDMLAGSTAAVKVIVLLSDGEPTYNYEVLDTADNATRLNNGTSEKLYTRFDYSSVDGSGNSLKYTVTTGGGCSSSSVTLDSGIAAVSEAQFAKDKGIAVYSIGYNVKSESSAASVMTNIASKNTNDNTYSYLASSNANVSNAIGTVLNSIKGQVEDSIAAARGTTLVDTLPEYMSISLSDQLADTLAIINSTENDSALTEGAGGIFTWDLGDLGAGVTKTVTIKAKIDIDGMVTAYATSHNATEAEVRAQMANGGVEFNLNELVSFTYQDKNGEDKVNTDINVNGTAKVPTEVFVAHNYTINYFIDNKPVSNATISGNAVKSEVITIPDLEAYNTTKFKSKTVKKDDAVYDATSFVMGDSNVTVNVYYVTNTFSVEFQAINAVSKEYETRKTETVKYGESATAPDGVIDSSYEENGYKYTATGWDKDFSNVTGDLTVQARYDKVERLNFDVTFKALDPKTGAEYTFGEYQVPTNTAMGNNFPVNEPTDVTGEAIGENLAKKTFEKWVVEGTETVVNKDYKFTSDTTVVAVYNDVVKKFTVSFYDMAGYELKGCAQTVEYGEKARSIEYPATNPYIGTDAVYEFAGWNFNFDEAIKGDKSIYPMTETYALNYTVTWMNGGDTYESTSVVYGNSASLTKDAPTKAADNEYTYEFLGWSIDANATDASDKVGTVKNVTKDITLYAIFGATEINYSYGFKYMDANGNWVTNEGRSNYHYKDEIDKAPEVPDTITVTSEDGTGTTKYTFTGWTYDKAYFVEAENAYRIIGSGYATANYDDGVTTYTVTFVYGENNVSETVIKNGKVTSVPDASKAPTDEFTYEFKNWECGETTYSSEDIYALKITESMTFVARYEGKENVYKLPVKVYVGSEEKTSTFTSGANWNKTVSYELKLSDYCDGENLRLHIASVKLGGDNLNSVDAFQEITINADTKGKVLSYYLVEDEKFTVTYKFGEEELAKSTPVYSGQTFTEPDEAAVKAKAKEEGMKTQQYSYSFNGWKDASDNEFTATTLTSNNVVVFASYTETINYYTVTYVDNELTAPESVTVPYGTTIDKLPELGTPEDTKDKDYTGINYWTENGKTIESLVVTGDVTVTAVHENDPQKYTVTFTDGMGWSTSSSQEYGTKVFPYSSEGLSKDEDARYTYAFAYWTKDGKEVDWNNEKVEGNVTYVAYFAPTERSFTVTFQNEDGTKVFATEKAVWNENGFYVTGTEARSEADKLAASKNESTTIYTYSFDKWMNGMEEFKVSDKITSNVTVNAVFAIETNEYTITYHKENGDVYTESGLLEAGKECVLGVEGPAKEASVSTVYTFAGWSTEQGKVDAVVDKIFLDGNKDVYAVYNESVREYTVTFMNGTTKFDETKYVPYGTKVSDVKIPEGTPTKDRTEVDGKIVTYSFEKWDYGNKTTVEDDITAYAKFGEKEYNKPAIDAGDDVNATYDGEAHQITVTVPEEVKNVKYVYDGNEYDSLDDIPEFINAGEYEVTVKGEYEVEGETYETEDSAKVIINQAKVTIRAEYKKKVYGAEDPELTVSIEGKPENGVALVYEVAREEGEDVATYSINVTAEAEKNPNYDTTTLANIFEITPAGAAVYFGKADEDMSDSFSLSKTYGEADPDYGVIVRGLVGKDDITYRVFREAGEDAGKYNVWIELGDEDLKPIDVVPVDIVPTADVTPVEALLVFEHVAENPKNGNYEFTTNGAVLTIGKLTITLSANDVELEENEEYSYWRTSIDKALPFGDSLKTYAFVWGHDNETSFNKGSYRIVPGYIAEDPGFPFDNYIINTVEGTLTVNKVIEEIPPVIPTEEDNPPTGNNPPADNNPPAENPPAENPPAENPPEVEIPEEPVPETPEIPKEPVVEPEPVVEVEPEVVEIEPEPVPEAPARCIIHWFILADTLLYALYAALRIVNNAKELKGENKEAEE